MTKFALKLLSKEHTKCDVDKLHINNCDDDDHRKILSRKFHDMKFDFFEPIIQKIKVKIRHPKCIFTNKEHDGMKNPLYIEIIDNVVKLRCEHIMCINEAFPIEDTKLVLTNDELRTLKRSAFDECILNNEIDVLSKNDNVNELFYEKCKQMNKSSEDYEKKQVSKRLKDSVWDEYIGVDNGSGKCLCCGITKIAQTNFHCGHYISRKNGGRTSLENMRPICAGCNLSMSSTNMDIFMQNNGFSEEKLLFDDSSDEYIENIIDIVNIIVQINKDNMCYDNLCWFFFNDDMWVKRNDMTIKEIADYVKLYDVMKDYLIKTKEMTEEQTNEFIKKMSTTKQRVYIISQIAKGVTKKMILDKNMNLIGFSNGVYDFEKMEFRKRQSSDMITMSCGYDFKSEYADKSNTLINLSKMFPIVGSMETFLMYVASSMCGKNNSKLMLVLSWMNTRYRDMLMRIMSSIFGDYYECIKNLSYIITKDDVNKKNLSNLKFARIVVTDLTKTITNNDITNLIYSKQIEHTNNKIIEKYDKLFSVFCMCENDLVIEKNVRKNTILIINENDDYDEFEFNKNDLFLLLLEHLEKIKHDNFSFTKIHFEPDGRSDDEKHCDEFRNEMIDCKKSKVYIKCVDLYHTYETWFINKKYEKSLKINKNILYNYLKIKKYQFSRAVRFGSTITSGFKLTLKPIIMM